MAWIEITTERVQKRLSQPEWDVARSLLLNVGQPDPLPETIVEVVNEVRGYVAACPRNTLGAGDTIPDKLISATLAIIVWRYVSRLPSPKLATEARKDMCDDAIRLLEQVAACKYAVEEPETPDSSETISSGHVDVVTSRPKKASGSQLEGL